MRQTFFRTQLLVALLALLPLWAAAQESVTLAKWTFDTGYDQADNVYTPNTSEWAKIGWNGFSTLPQILPNEFAGNQSDYYVSAKGTRFWGIQENYDAKIMSLYQDQDPNNITDYTDATQHNQYFEIGFPTKGYKNIQFTFAFTCGDNNVRNLEMVVSTDGGKTWSDAGGYPGGATWWVYNTNTVQMSANNKESVIVRLIAPNDVTAQWRMNEISISGEQAEGGKQVSEAGFTATWPLNTSEVVTAAATSAEGLFSVAELSWGDKLTTAGLRTDAGVVRQQFQPTEAGAADDDASAIVFTMKPKKALTFTPKRLSFKASRVGTNGGAFNVVVESGGQSTKVGEGITPQLAKEDPYVSVHEFDLSGIPATDDLFYVKIYVYNLATNKQYAFSDVVITGDVAGTIEAVPAYTLSVKLGTEGAGKVSSNPAGNEFDEGTSITVSATENFGYHFKAWTDADGKEVSDKLSYTFDIKENTTLIATYDKIDTYALNLKLEGGANDNLVQLQPVGNVVDGVHWYETGTDVKLTSYNNRILTFTGWEGDASGTSAETLIHIDGTKNVTANFSCVDFIVGWDLYYDQPAKDRVADYKADSENAGMLSLRKADGTTNGWLTRGSQNGQENGKYAARIWKYLSEQWYFEISFSSKGYQNLILSSCLGDDYNTYSVNNVEYSTDGTTFTKIGEFNPPARGWDGPKEFALPADANDKDRVWIRWMPDRTSELIGVSSDYDGTSVAEIYVLADAGSLAEEQATLVSSNPANGSANASRNGSIILNFDKKIKAGEGKATLDGEEIAPIISGKSAIFKYGGLKYGTQYTFNMPEGVLTSRSGNKVAATSITFTTMERQQPVAKLYDAVVAQDGSGDYQTLQAAIDAAPAQRGTPWLIFVKNGRYNEHIDIPVTKTNLHIIGQDRDKAVIYDDRLCGGDNAYSVDPGATVVVKGTDTFFENITLENSYGHEKQAGPQALALNTVADRVALNNVALLSYQDTWITTSTQKNRHYIKNSLIEGAVDFIYNGGDVYLDGDTIEINRTSGGYIVAPNHTADTKWGYVFQNNIIRPGKDFKTGQTLNVTDVWLGRPWHNAPKTVFINTQTFVPIPAKGWYNTMGGLPELWADYNTVDANGNPLDLSQRETYYYYTDRDTGEKVEKFNVKNYLTDEEAAQYTLKNVMGGDDNWQPDLLCEACDAPNVKGEGTQLSWEAVPYAICYVVTKNGEVAGFTTETTFSGYTAADKWQVQAVNENGGLSKKATANEATAISKVAGSKSQASGTAFYGIDGSMRTALTNGVNIIRDAQGNIRKVVK